MDSHMHLDYYPEEEREEIVGRAWAAGLRQMVSVCVALKGADTLHAIGEMCPGRIFYSIGAHPTLLEENAFSPSLLRSCLDRFQPVAVGETGLDFFSLPKDSGAAANCVQRQKEAFLQQACAARDRGLPLIIHCRDRDSGSRDGWFAMDEILRESNFDRSRALFHCFDYGPEELEEWQGEGGYVSFSGSVTRKGHGAAQRAARLADRDRLLLETDAPFLLPEPLHSSAPRTRCEPAHLRLTSAFLGELLHLREEDLLAMSLRNGQRFFALGEEWR
jgi:TatD DNase family protein